MYEQWINKGVNDIAYVSSRIYFLFLKSYAPTVPVGKNSYFSMGQVFRACWGIHSINLCRKVKVKESRNMPGVAQKVPGGLGSQISWHSARESGEVFVGRNCQKWENFASSNLSLNMQGLTNLHTAISTNNTYFIKFI
jgi:hypothetical protein